jgi:hypothetical protein
MAFGNAVELCTGIMEDYDDDTPMAMSIWYVDDVEYKVDMMGVELESRYFKDVLQYFSEHEDASVGLNWDTLEDAIYGVIGNLEETGDPLGRTTHHEPFIESDPEGDPPLEVLLLEDSPEVEDIKEEDDEREIT